MAIIASCPKCAKQLGLPEEFESTDRAECPECRAVFSLSETVQITLPVVRMLDPSEEPAPPSMATDDAQPHNPDDATDDLASNTAPLKSWEERLKNALALDCSSDTVADSPETSDVGGGESATPRQPPSFDFDLDPTPATAMDPAQPTGNLESPEEPPTPPTSSTIEEIGTTQTKKTLADIDAEAKTCSQDLEIPAATTPLSGRRPCNSHQADAISSTGSGFYAQKCQ